MWTEGKVSWSASRKAGGKDLKSHLCVNIIAITDSIQWFRSLLAFFSSGLFAIVLSDFNKLITSRKTTERRVHQVKNIQMSHSAGEPLQILASEILLTGASASPGFPEECSAMCFSPKPFHFYCDFCQIEEKSSKIYFKLIHIGIIRLIIFNQLGIVPLFITT